MPSLLTRWLARWRRKTAPPAGSGMDPLGATWWDAGRRRPPLASELLAELRNTAYACASLNAAVCASFPPRLYVSTAPGEPPPRCATRQLAPAQARRLGQRLPGRCIAEVLDHPLLTLLRQVNPVHNAFDLWELTTLYQEVFGCAYWLLRRDVLGVPREIWVLPSQHVTPRRQPGSSAVVDYYEYRPGGQAQRFAPEEIIHFRYPDPGDPYHAGLSPLRAAFDSVLLASEYRAFKQATWDNYALPSAIVSPEEALSPEERARLEAQWNQVCRRGGAGRILVADTGLRVHLLSHRPADLAALAELRATKEDIANAFGVPLAFLTSETNLANLQAAEAQHARKAIRPRLRRRDDKLNEQLLPLFDPSGRLFLASDDPVPDDRQAALAEQECDLRWGVRTINEVRQERGLPPVPWGEAPGPPHRRNW
ncbi:MAG: phage portal protein [Gemmataceae bacterium]|nr:phage portal protein [Gemmataceae bacterium]MDW8265159.1 phage portal protein [Gemmataceae bacterium]